MGIVVQWLAVPRAPIRPRVPRRLMANRRFLAWFVARLHRRYYICHLAIFGQRSLLRSPQQWGLVQLRLRARSTFCSAAAAGHLAANANKTRRR